MAPRGSTSTPELRTRRVLVIGNGTRVGMTEMLCGLEPWCVPWNDFAPAMLRERRLGLVVPVVETFTATASGFFALAARGSVPGPVLAVLPEEAVESAPFRDAVSAVEDFIVTPVRVSEWRQRVARLLGTATDPTAPVTERLTHEASLSQLVGSAPPFVEIVNRIPLVARSGCPALITGETGTGKELCARAIHAMGPRRSKPFIPVDCAALPDHLCENELFGHVRGAFTDAHRDQRGLIGLADGGTLFLDEIDSLSPATQAKLLRFLQERSYRPLGADRFATADVHVLAAMNRDPDELVRAHLLRADLFFRLNVFRLHLVPLRERMADVPLLARHFAAAAARDAGQGSKTLSASAIARLMSYEWPGNARELSNVMRRAVVLATDRCVLAEHIVLPADAGAPSEPTGAATMSDVSFREGRALAVRAFERTYVAQMLEKHGGNVTRAARDSHKDRRAFGRLLKKHGLKGGVAGH